MSLISGLQLLYPLASNTDELINSDNATNSGISFGTHSGVASADFTAPDYAYAANSTYNFSFGTGDFTFSVWVNPDTVFYGPATQGTIFGTDFPNYELSIYQGNIQCYLLGAANVISTTTGTAVTTGAWQHVVVVRTGGTATIYVDNVAPTQSPTGSPGTTDITSTGSPQFQIGQRVSSANNHYDGKMADVALWNRALNGSEITDVYNAGAGGLSGLVTSGNQSSINLFTSVVHNSTPPTANAINLYTSVVHDATPPTANAINLFSSVVHDPTQISGTLADITGTVNVSASFDGSVLGYSTSSVNLQWTWQSVPAGSSLTNQSYPLPDNNANTYFNMTNNVGLWHFEGNAQDSSGNGRDGTPNNASLVAGKVGSQAYQFIDTDDSYVDFGQASDFLSTSSPFSVAIWIKGDSGWTPAQYDSILGFSNAFNWTEGVGIYWDDATTIRGFINRYDQEPVDGTITNVEEWNHIVMTYDQTDLKMYINGSLTQTQDRSITLNGLSNNLQVGRLGTHGRLEASLDEFAIWERTLSDLEVNNLYFLQSGSLATDLVGNVGLGETFTFVPDVTGTFTTNLTVTDGASSLSGNANAVITEAPTPPSGPITGSNPTVNLVESEELGYVFNTYKINLLSVQRSRTSEQVPFKLGTKGKQSLRVRTNTEFTGSS